MPLKVGSNVLRVSYAGSDVERAALVDAFMLVPRVLTRLFNGPDGKSLTLHYEMSSGELMWNDQ